SHKDKIGTEINWRAARESIEALKQRNRELEGKMIKPDPLEGYEDHEMVTVADLKKIREYDRQNWNRELAQKEMYVQEQILKARHSDYDEVVTKYAKEAFEESPILAAALEGVPNKALYAYEIGKSRQMLNKAKSSVPTASPEPYLNNVSLPGNLSSVAGEGRSGEFTGEAVWDMDDKSFEEYCRKSGTPIFPENSISLDKLWKTPPLVVLYASGGVETASAAAPGYLTEKDIQIAKSHIPDNARQPTYWVLGHPDILSYDLQKIPSFIASANYPNNNVVISGMEVGAVLDTRWMSSPEGIKRTTGSLSGVTGAATATEADPHYALFVIIAQAYGGMGPLIFKDDSGKWKISCEGAIWIIKIICRNSKNFTPIP
ncbi:MAG: hypothetical protein RR599_00740, partial [Victivallaceae bacterium]